MYMVYLSEFCTIPQSNVTYTKFDAKENEHAIKNVNLSIKEAKGKPTSKSRLRCTNSCPRETHLRISQTATRQTLHPKN